MSAEAAAVSHSWSIGRFTATVTMAKPRPGQIASAVIEWSPHPPPHLTVEEIEQYRAGRDAAIKALGLCALVVEL